LKSRWDWTKKRSQQYCAKIDAVMTGADEAQKIFENANIAIQAAISTLGRHDAALDRRTAKMKDMRDALRGVIMGPHN
jgi:hypothetical protein